MKPRTLLTLVVVALLVTTGIASAAVTGSPEISVNVADDTLTPGEEGTLDVVLVNSGDLESGSARNPALNSEVTTARGTTVRVRSGGAPFEVTTGEQAIGTLRTGATQQPISFGVSVPDDAEPGTYEVPVTVEYDYYSYVSETDGSRDRESTTQTFDVSVTIEESAQLSVVDVSTSTRVGGTGTVELTVENTGSAAATDATVSLASSTSSLAFGQSGTATRYVENWATGEQRTFEYQLTATRSAETESHPFTLTADYDLPNGEPRSTLPTSVPVQPQPEQEFTVVSTTNNVPIAGSGTFDVTLRNDGPDVATDASVTLTSQNSDITFGQTNTASRTVGRWEPGETRTITFDTRASPSAQRQNYSLSASVAFDDTDGNAGQVQGLTVGLVPNSQRFSVVSTNSSVPAGATGEYTVTLRNEGSTDLDDASLSLTSRSADVTFGQSTSANQFVGDWAAGETRTITFDATAGPRAEQRDYTLSASVSYERSSGTTGQSQGLTVGLVPGPERFTVVSTGSDVPVGDTGEYTVTLRNDGPTALEDSSLTLTSQNADITFGQSSSASQFVGSWAVGETRTATFDVTAGAGAEQRDYAIDGTLSYTTVDGSATQQGSVSLGLQPTAEQTFAVDNVETSLQVGDDGQLQGEVTNTGPRAVADVVVVWASEQRNVSPIETEYSVGRLEAGGSAEFTFDVDISDSARSGPRQFTLQAQYENSEGQQRTSDSLNVRAEVAPESDEFDVTLESANVTAGEGTTIELQITNAKSEPLRDISAKVFADSPISASDDEAFVSELAPGESTTITFSISASGGALEKIYPVSMDFQYEEADGDTVTSSTYNIPVSVNEPSGGGGLPLPVIGGGIVLALLGVGAYVRFR